jgi:hypothetical protein
MPPLALGKLSFSFEESCTSVNSYSASAAKDALSDKASEHKHDAKAEAHKQQI